MLPKTTGLGSRDGSQPDLDQTRVSSMADEGGAAGAQMDAYEQRAPLELMSRRLPSWPVVLSWAALVAGGAVLSFAWFSRKRTRGPVWSSLWR
jgi:hypothetical protein